MLDTSNINDKVKKLAIKQNLFFDKLVNYFNPKFIDINNQKVVKKFPWLKIFGWLLFSIIVVLIFVLIKPDFQNFKHFQNSLKHFFEYKTIQIGGATFSPAETFQRSLKYLWTTISYSILGTLLGILISVPLALLSSKNFIKNKFIYMPFRIIMSIFRAVPPIVFAFMFYFVLSKSLAATITIAFFIASLMTKWLYEDLDTYDFSTYNAIQAFGNNKIIAFNNSILPYLIKRIVSYGLYSFEMVVRFAAILSVVGIETIGTLLIDQYATTNNFSHLSIALWTLIAFMTLLEVFNFVIKKYFLEYTPKHPTIDEKLPLNKQIESLKKQRPKIYIWKIVFWIALIALVIVTIATQIEWKIANKVKLNFFKNGMRKLFSPDWNLFLTPLKNSKTNPITTGFQAFFVALASSVVGIVFALIIGIMAARNVNKYACYPFKMLIIILRAIPLFTFVALFLLMQKDSIIFASVLALGIHSIGMLGKLIMESVEKIPRKVFESLDALGASWFQKIRYGVIRSIFPQVVSNFLYRIEINFKSTVVIGFVGASSFGFQIQIYSTDPNNWDKLASYLLFTIVILLILEQISNLIRSKLMTGYFFKEDVWFKKIAKRKLFIRTLAICKTNNEKFNYDFKFAKYILAKHKFEKLALLNYYLSNNKVLPNFEEYNQLYVNKELYLKTLKFEIKNIKNEINWKKLKQEVLTEIKDSINKSFKPYQFIAKTKFIHKCIEEKYEEYFNSNVNKQFSFVS